MFFSLPFIHIRDRIGNTLLLGALCGALVGLWKLRAAAGDWIMIAIAGFFLGYAHNLPKPWL